MENIQPIVQVHPEARDHRLEAVEIGSATRVVDELADKALGKSVRVMRQNDLSDSRLEEGRIDTDDNPCICRASD